MCSVCTALGGPLPVWSATDFNRSSTACSWGTVWGLRTRSTALRSCGADAVVAVDALWELRRSGRAVASRPCAHACAHVCTNTRVCTCVACLRTRTCVRVCVCTHAFLCERVCRSSSVILAFPSQALPGPHYYAWGDHGGIIMAIAQGTETSELK